MSSRSIDFPHCKRNATLAACLAAALGLTAASAHSNDLSTAPAENPLGPNPVKPAFDLPAYLRTSGGRIAATSRPTNKPDALPHYVTNCGDDIATPGTLRYEVANAPDFATIDLSTLVCSTITLGSEITVLQDNLSLLGPGSANLTVDGNAHSRIFKHTGAGMLAVYYLTIANGYYTSGNAANGGCISSTGDVYLARSVITHCSLEITGNHGGRGAGVYAKGNLQLGRSTITDSHAYAALGQANGGGAYVIGEFDAIYSTISDNTAYDHSSYSYNKSRAGGVFVDGNVWIISSTISGNGAEYDGGLHLGGGVGRTAEIADTTISTNTSSTSLSGVAGMWTNVPLNLYNSTVAFNRSSSSIGGSGLYSQAPLTLVSSIIADNIGSEGESDLDGQIGTNVGGFGNLIVKPFLLVPVDTIQACPQLEPLADNGGYTRTHALQHTSPAIDAGYNPLPLTLDQRVAPRVAGIKADIGSVEWQPGETDERIFVSGFDGLCDQ